MAHLRIAEYNDTTLEHYNNKIFLNNVRSYFQLDTAGKWHEGYECEVIENGQWHECWLHLNLKWVVAQIKMNNRRADFTAMRYYQQDHNQ